MLHKHTQYVILTASLGQQSCTNTPHRYVTHTHTGCPVFPDQQTQNNNSTYRHTKTPLPSPIYVTNKSKIVYIVRTE